MANCPKCNAHLKLTDWKQHCPHCGANIVVYDLQERLMQDADKAEVQNYHFQKKIDRVKASFIGSKLAIVRIITSLLPAGGLFLPLINAKFTAPFEEFEGGITILTVFDKLNAITDALGGLFEGDLKSSSIFFAAAAVLLVLSILLVVIRFILLTLACSPKGKVRNYTIDALLLITTLGSIVAFMLMPKGGAVTGSVGIGGWLYLLLQIVNVVVDVLTFKKGIEIHHKQCYVGGIEIEEYFKMVESGMTTEEIRVVQYDKLRALQEEKERKLAEDEAKKAAEEAKKEGN